MSLFDQLVTQALKTQVELSPLRVVVEKELLHHDILREMNDGISRESFVQEMRRFLPPVIAKRTVESDEFWQYLCTTVTQQGLRVLSYLTEGNSSGDLFKM